MNLNFILRIPYTSTFILPIFTPLSLHAQSADIQMKVVPQGEDSTSPSPVLPTKSLQKKALPFQKSLTTPETSLPNEEEVASPAESTQSAAPQQALAATRGAFFQQVGGESGAFLIRFRGVRSLSTAFLWDGVPLLGSLQGAHNLDLLPGIMVARVHLYPDLLPWWYETSGIAGGADYSLAHDVPVRFSSSARLRGGSFGLWESSASHTLHQQNVRIKFGVNSAQSREDFLVVNNNGTTFRTDDDSIEKRRNNDFQRLSGGMVATLPSCIENGGCHFSLSAGAEERGLAGPIGSDSHARLSRTLLVTTGKLRHVSDRSGAETLGETFARIETTRSSFSGNAILVGQRLRHIISLTEQVSFGGAGSLLFERMTLRDEQGAKETLTGTRTQADATLMVSTHYPFLQNLQWSTLFFAKANGATAATKQACPARRCTRSTSQREITLPSGGASLQVGSTNSGAFVKVTHAKRRPWLTESLGSVGGVLANPDIRPEASNRVEGGIVTPFGKSLCWRGRDTDLILQEIVGPRQSRSRNLAQVTRWGCGAESGVEIWNHVSLEGSYYYTQARFSHPDMVGQKDLPRTPAHEVSATLAAHDVPLLEQNSGTLRTGAQFTWTRRSAQFLDGGNTISLQIPDDVQAQWDFTWETSPQDQRLTLSLQMQNMLDDTTSRQRDVHGWTAQVDHAGFPGYPDPGRRISLSLSANF